MYRVPILPKFLDQFSTKKIGLLEPITRLICQPLVGGAAKGTG